MTADAPLYGTNESVRADYAETHALYRMLVDIRFKLLAFVPTATGVAVGVLGEEHLANGATGLGFGIGLLGFFVTLGVIIYEVRNSQIHDRAIHRLAHLEKLLGFRPSVIASGPGGFFSERGPRLSVLGIGLWHDRALGLIYGSVIGAWVWLIYANAGSLHLPALPGPDIDQVVIPVVVGVAVAWQIVALSATGRSGGPIYELVPLDPGIEHGCEIITSVVRQIAAWNAGWEQRPHGAWLRLGSWSPLWWDKELRTDRTEDELKKHECEPLEVDYEKRLDLVRGLGLIETARVAIPRRARPRHRTDDSHAAARESARRRWRLTTAGHELLEAGKQRNADDSEREKLLKAFRAGVVGFEDVWRQRADPKAPDPIERYGRGAPWCAPAEIVCRVAWATTLDPTVHGAGSGTVGGMESFTASAITHLLVVSDTDASRDWYVRVLEASVHGQYGTSVVLELCGTWLLLVTEGEPTPDKPTVTLSPPDDVDLVSSEMIFRVDDCRATYDLLDARGAQFLTEPVDRGGEIRAFFRDPDGHLLEISQLTD